jgi:hypothetical protein
MNVKHAARFTGAMPTRFAGLDAPRATPAPERMRHFDEAMLLMEDGHWQRAFTRLAALADTGHPQAARIAMVFVQRGALLFGGSFMASARQRECWQRAGN